MTSVYAELALFLVVRLLRRPRNPKWVASMIDRMSKVASSPVIAVVALVMLAVAPEPTKRRLHAARGLLERHARTVAAVILVLLAAVLMRNGIAGLSG